MTQTDDFFHRKDLIIELALAILVFVIIAGGAFYWFTRPRATTVQEECFNNQRRMEGAAIMHQARRGEWPEELAELFDGSPPECPEGGLYSVSYHNRDLSIECDIHGYYRNDDRDDGGEGGGA